MDQSSPEHHFLNDPSNSHANSGTRRALEIPEVLESILACAENSTLASCATVSRSWTSIALDKLWRDLKCIVPLLEILSPLEAAIGDGGGDMTEWVRATQTLGL